MNFRIKRSSSCFSKRNKSSKKRSNKLIHTLQVITLVIALIIGLGEGFILIRYTFDRGRSSNINRSRDDHLKNKRTFFQLDNSYRNDTTKIMKRLLSSSSACTSDVISKEDEYAEEEEEYCVLIDELGCEAIQNKTMKSYKTVDDCDVSIESCIRIQSKPEFDELSLSCSKNISREEVWNRIDHVRNKQGRAVRVDLYPRYWEIVVENNTAASSAGFSTMQLNTLAEGLSYGPNCITPFSSYQNKEDRTDNGKNCFGGFTNVANPELCLDFNLRRWRLIELVLSSAFSNCTAAAAEGQSSLCIGPDLLALQEVDRYHGFFKPILHAFGYNSIFMPKPLSPGVSLGWYSDGTALFWKKDVFQLIYEKRSGFQCGSQVYLITLLKHIPSENLIVVAATHLKAGSEIHNENIRILQSNQLIQEVHHLINQQLPSISSHQVNNNGNIPIIIMGDFNCVPTGECIRNTFLQQSFKSAYPLFHNKEYSNYTTWKIRDNNIVTKRISDYIFYQNNPNHDDTSLQCTHVLTLPKENEIEDSFLPGFRHPSDHLNIAAKFRFL